MYVLALLQLLRRLCTFWCSILSSGQRSFVLLCCDTRMCLQFRGCPVVLDSELSMSAWYHKTRRALLRARRLLLLLLLTAEGNERWLAVCGTTFKLASNGAEKQNNDSAAPKTPPLEKNIFIVLEIPCTLLLAAKNTNGYTSDMPSMQPTEHPRTSPPD